MSVDILVLYKFVYYYNYLCQINWIILNLFSFQILDRDPFRVIGNSIQQLSCIGFRATKHHLPYGGELGVILSSMLRLCFRTANWSIWLVMPCTRSVNGWRCDICRCLHRHRLRSVVVVVAAAAAAVVVIVVVVVLVAVAVVSLWQQQY